MLRIFSRKRLDICVLIFASFVVGSLYGKFLGRDQQAQVIAKLKEDKAIAEQKVKALSQELPKLRAQFDNMVEIQTEIGKLRSDINRLKTPAP